MIKDVTRTIENEMKVQKGEFFVMLLCILVACLLGNMLTGKGVVRASNETIRAGDGVIRAR